MTDIAVTMKQVGQVIPPPRNHIVTLIAGVALNAGDIVYVDANGKAQKTNASAAPTAKFRGVVMETVSAGSGTSVLFEGHISGFNINGLAYDAPVYLSNNAGMLSDTPGTNSVLVGRVNPIPENGPSGVLPKVLYIMGMAG